ncbi:expressed unknown protein [Seminavis robusta]|uniref:Uncharacterized protein n=1 Tax=Seminavis robusta TaxID=568900 RepID=A0A9N8H4T2_9STRA|nr:expressed unknown protein [Seminavis robusta]CAB9524165.1 expressed unknown protein [Seminavis robusta]|eukprot:Sro13_g009660.1 n/a (144) ;mRNA; f:2497-2928
MMMNDPASVKDGFKATGQRPAGFPSRVSMTPHQPSRGGNSGQPNTDATLAGATSGAATHDFVVGLGERPVSVIEVLCGERANRRGQALDVPAIHFVMDDRGMNNLPGNYPTLVEVRGNNWPRANGEAMRLADIIDRTLEELDF